MKKTALVPLCTLGLAALTTACSGGGSSSHTDTPKEPAKGFVYALSQHGGGTNQIQGYSLDLASGSLRALSGMPVNTGGLGSTMSCSQQLAYDASHQRLYALNSGGGTVTAYAVDPSTGALSPCPFSPINLGTANWMSLAVHPSGSTLAVGNDAAISTYRIEGNSATPPPGNPHAVGDGAFSCAFTPNGAFLYAGGNTGTTLNGFSVSTSDGSLTALSGSPFSMGTWPAAYAIDDKDRLFIGNGGSTLSVRVATLSSGIPTSAFSVASGLSSAVHGLLHPAGYYFLADRTNNQIGVYRIAGSGSGTTLTPITGSPFATGGASLRTMALSPNGKYLLASHGGSRNLAVFSVDGATGTLTRLNLQPANALDTTGDITGLVCVPSL